MLIIEVKFRVYDSKIPGNDVSFSTSYSLTSVERARSEEHKLPSLAKSLAIKFWESIVLLGVLDK